MNRLYHIVAINEHTGLLVLVTGYPMPHKQACTNMSKFSYHPARRIQLLEVRKDFGVLS